MEKLPEELTQTDHKFLSMASQSKSNNQGDEHEALDWPSEVSDEGRERVMRKLRASLSSWVATEGGEAIGEDSVVIDKREVDRGILTSTISIHDLAMMFAELILRLEPSVEGYFDFLGTGISPTQTLQDFTAHSEEQGYGLEDSINRPNSFFSFMVKDANSR